MRQTLPMLLAKLLPGLGLWGLSGIALGLRLWGLGRFNQLIFDETYYIPFALGYLNQSPAFDAHPPLGKYLIALGLWLGQWPADWFHWPMLTVEGQTMSLVGGRAINALVGSTFPALVAALAYGLSCGAPQPRRVRFSLVAAGLMTLEGLTLVESRLALINPYWLWFGLLGQVCWVGARTAAQPWLWRTGAGMALGSAINVKWNGAAFLLGVLLWEGLPCGPSPRPWRRWLVYLGLIPLATYSLLWVPHLAITGESFWDIHRQLWQVHQTIGAEGLTHPYCSAWFTWPLMLRPLAYFYEVLATEPKIVVAIQAMGNPILWWLSAAAMLALGLGWLSDTTLSRPTTEAAPSACGPRPAEVASLATDPTPKALAGKAGSVESFLVLNYLAQWLPWMVVSRCTFLYHALGMVAFSAMALAWLLSGWLGHRRRAYRLWAWAMLSLVALGFLFWLPLFLGLPLSSDALQRRWWLPTWV